MLHPNRLLRWLYLGRLTLAAGIFGGALLIWPRTTPEVTLLATLAFILSLAVTLGGMWHTHLRHREPSSNFLYLQIVFDALLVTAVVHLTGGSESDFAPLYILVIAAGALLLPLPGGVLVGALASILYFADIVLVHAAEPPATVFVQIGLFAVMALATGFLGDRLRQTGTALGEAEHALRQLRLEHGEILETIDTGVVTVDDEGRLAYMNRAAEVLLSLREREWMGRPVLDALDRAASGLGGLVRQTGASRVPVRWYETQAAGWGEGPGRLGGRMIGVRTTVLEREGHETPWVTAVLQDITDGKQVEELNRRAARLQAVAELAAALAHEIRNPLASIRSAVEQITNPKLARSDHGILERLVVNESERLSRLLSEFIEFSWVRLEQRTDVELGALLADVIELVKRHPDGGSARVEYTPPTSPIFIDGDEDLLHRAFFNLVLNGVQHAGPDGQVHVEATRPAPSGLPPGVRITAPVRVVVRDSGPGVPQEDRPRIFDPFYTTRPGGTGLGLAVVHRALEAHQGTILVDDAPEGGARFTIFLPGRE